MKMIAEEENINNIINQLEKKFNLKKEIQITLQPGGNLNEDIFKPALKDSLEVAHKKIGTIVNPKEYQLKENQLYVIGFQETNGQNLVDFVFPYGINIANLLSNTIIKETKDEKMKPDEIKKYLHDVFEESVVHIVTQELFKFYMPDSKKVPAVPKKILDQVSYEGLKNDDFNVLMTFVLPLDSLYEPLKEAIKAHKPDTNYGKLSLAPLHSISYDQKTKEVRLVTSLN